MWILILIFTYFNADPDPPALYSDGNLRPLVYIDPQGFLFEPPCLHCELPRLYSVPLKLLNFDFNAEQSSAFHSNADPDQ
jgi:hypothetical protein